MTWRRLQEFEESTCLSALRCFSEVNQYLAILVSKLSCDILDYLPQPLRNDATTTVPHIVKFDKNRKNMFVVGAAYDVALGPEKLMLL